MRQGAVSNATYNYKNNHMLRLAACLLVQSGNLRNLRADLLHNRLVAVLETIASILNRARPIKFHLLLLRNGLLAYNFREALEAGSLQPCQSVSFCSLILFLYCLGKVGEWTYKKEYTSPTR